MITISILSNCHSHLFPLQFEIARKLKGNVQKIRASYTKDLSSTSSLERQLATAMWVIDRLALRVGNEKGGDEADTVGCCSLRVEHITLIGGEEVEFDFLAKDSMRYFNRVCLFYFLLDIFVGTFVFFVFLYFSILFWSSFFPFFFLGESRPQSLRQF